MSKVLAENKISRLLQPSTFESIKIQNKIAYANEHLCTAYANCVRLYFA